MKLRSSWVLSHEEQSRFDAFDYVSPATIEEELAEWSDEAVRRSSKGEAGEGEGSTAPAQGRQKLRATY